MENNIEEEKKFKFSESPTIEDIRQTMERFAADRDWDKFHTPRNLLLALVILISYVM
jgi:hypothetical protein